MKTLVYFFLMFMLLLQSQAQTREDCLVAAYNFNGHNANDDIGSCNGKAVGATLVTDRFGNPNAAWYFYGNPQSYLNLGTYATLKPVKGSISIWFRLDNVVYSGSGFAYNPLIHTKCQQGNNCYESYALYYAYNTQQMLGGSTQLYCNQPTVYSGLVTQQIWHHVVFTYDNTMERIYLDGVKKDSIPKNFLTTFLASDSVMVATSANVQNNRQFNGAVDDIRFYNCVIGQDEVTSIYHEGNVTGISEASGLEHVKVYYSAPDHQVHVALPAGGKYQVDVTDMLGKTIFRETYQGDNYVFDLPEVAQGMLLVRVSNSLGYTVKKIMAGM